MEQKYPQVVKFMDLDIYGTDFQTMNLTTREIVFGAWNCENIFTQKCWLILYYITNDNSVMCHLMPQWHLPQSSLKCHLPLQSDILYIQLTVASMVLYRTLLGIQLPGCTKVFSSSCQSGRWHCGIEQHIIYVRRYGKNRRNWTEVKIRHYFFHCLFCFLYITESLINFLSTAVCFISIGHLVGKF